MTKNIAVIFLCFQLTACVFPGVYRIDIPQGNTVNQEMLDQLKLGMSPAQVRFVLGTPLITDPFNLNRWDYFYSIRKHDQEFQQQLITIYFKNNRLEKIEGELYQPPNKTNDDPNEAIDTNDS